jgi:hypothetical protein
MNINPAWLASGAVLIGGFVSIFRPDNKLCPVDLSPMQRSLLTGVLGAVQAALMSVAGGASVSDACLTAAGSVVAVLLAHGNSASDAKVEAPPPPPVLH